MRNAKTLASIAKDGLDVGLDWYPHTRYQLGYVTDQCSILTVRESIEVFSVLSPRCSLTRNIRNWLSYLQTGQLLHPTIRSVRRSLELWQSGFYAEHGMPYKVGRFASALMGDHSSIVVDTWICKALGVEQHRLKNNTLRKAIDRRMLSVSDCLGYSPRDTQASLWVGIIRQHGRQARLPDIIGEFDRCEF